MIMHSRISCFIVIFGKVKGLKNLVVCINMMFEVFYYSLTGNTKKVANAIAEELGVKAEKVNSKKGMEKDSFVFLGSAQYAWKLPRPVINFIKKNDFTGREVAIFGTCSDKDNPSVDKVEKLVKDSGGVVRGKFFCIGSMMKFANRGFPNERDLEDAREFAKKMREK
jgi:flavodoxin